MICPICREEMEILERPVLTKDYDYWDFSFDEWRDDLLRTVYACKADRLKLLVSLPVRVSSLEQDECE